MLETIDIPDYGNNRLTFKSKVYQKVIRKIPKSLLPSFGEYNLTISKEKKFVWFRVAKVGTRSVYNIFKNQSFRLDADHTFGCYYIPYVYRDYYKFAFVRNPYDRLVSSWKDKVLKLNHFQFSEVEYEKMQQFENFVTWVSHLDIDTANNHLRPLNKLIDLNHIDFIGRFERFDHDLSIVLDKLDICETIPMINASQDNRHYSSFYTEELRQKVYKIYEKDFLIFNYDSNIIYE